MLASSPLRFLFIINKGSGKDDTDWQNIIREKFGTTAHKPVIFELPDSCCPEDIAQQIEKEKPDRVIAVGGDGTVKLTAQCCMEAGLPLGVLPAGSANGLAKELGIPANAGQALDIVLKGHTKKIHLTRVNGELCIHLADMGFNASIIRKFENYDSRGMWGYIKAAWAVLRSHHRMQAQLQVDGETQAETAAMIVIANATTYGSGATINPKGQLDDDLFEVVVVRKVSFSEIFKMMFTHRPYDPAKTVVYQTTSVKIHSKKPVHFQVDGEYFGKVNDIKAKVLPEAVEIIVPGV